jgi:ribonucleotide monophosphatase NagD (HAD superfamily)
VKETRKLGIGKPTEIISRVAICQVESGDQAYEILESYVAGNPELNTWMMGDEPDEEIRFRLSKVE